MANPHRGQVSLQVGEATYVLSFSVNALCELEDQLDRPVAKIADELNDPASVRLSTVRAMVWGALRDNHPEVTLADAGRIATEAGVAACMEKVGEAFQLAFPDASEAKGNARPQKAKAG